MDGINHFMISAALGSTLGPVVPVVHGSLGAKQLSATLQRLAHSRRSALESLTVSGDVSKRYDRLVRQAFLDVRQDRSADRVIADPALNGRFVTRCRDLGLRDRAYYLNRSLLRLRKRGSLKLNHGSKREPTPGNEWQYAAAAEIAARALYYQTGLSVDSLLCHPELSTEFDELAIALAPGFTSVEYRWAAINARKRGPGRVQRGLALADLRWDDSSFLDTEDVPDDEGVYLLSEGGTALFVGSTEDLHETLEAQRTLAEVPLVEPSLWRPDLHRMHWRFATLPDVLATDRDRLAKEMVGSQRPVFNIPRGARTRAA